MNTVVLTSSILGPLLLLLGIGLFINSAYYKNTIEHITDKTHTLILAGILGIIAGSYMVANHNIAEGTPAVIISILGWIVLLKSSLILALPQSFTQAIKKIKYDIVSIKSVGIIYIVLGLYLMNYSYFGVGFGM
ncbi:MAG: hypothetical protein PHS49_02430 [Candidatus Gracilibacteria bacterium]|nr:hypothetical protein [Candidatus Gracilibacteria bacterium]